MTKLGDAQSMITALTRAGVKMPTEVTEASARARFNVSVPTTSDAEQLIAKAGTQAEFDSAVHEFALAVTVAEVANFHRLTDAVANAHESMFDGLLRPMTGTFMDAVCENFNSAAPKFSEAVSRIPDLSGKGPLDISEDASRALQDAKSAIVPLQVQWAAYKAILKFLGAANETGQSGPSASRIVARLGSFSTAESHRAAVELVYGYARKREDLSLNALAPFVAIPRGGGTLELVRPSVANERYSEIPDAPRAVNYAAGMR